MRGVFDRDEIGIVISVQKGKCEEIPSQAIMVHEQNGLSDWRLPPRAEQEAIKIGAGLDAIRLLGEAECGRASKRHAKRPDLVMIDMLIQQGAFLIGIRQKQVKGGKAVFNPDLRLSHHSRL